MQKMFSISAHVTARLAILRVNLNNKTYPHTDAILSKLIIGAQIHKKLLQPGLSCIYGCPPLSTQSAMALLVNRPCNSVSNKISMKKDEQRGKRVNETTVNMRLIWSQHLTAEIHHPIMKQHTKVGIL